MHDLLLSTLALPPSLPSVHDLLLSCREQTRAVCARTCLEFAPSAEGEANQFVCLATHAAVGCNVTLDEVRARVRVRFGFGLRLGFG